VPVEKLIMTTLGRHFQVEEQKLRDLIKTKSNRIVLIDVGENDVAEFRRGVRNHMETESNGNIKMINLDGENTKYFYQNVHFGLNTVWHRIIKQSF